MTSPSVRIVLVDTNCFLRLYQSPVVPLLGQDIGGYRLLTLECLVDEFDVNSTLAAHYSWVVSGPKRNDLERAKLKLRGPSKAAVAKRIQELKPFGKSLLESYCKHNQILPIRNLSRVDIELLATAVALNGIMATDEWPLRHVAKDLMEDPDEYGIGLFTSLELLHLLETNGKLSSDDRRNTVDSWVRLGENLIRGWQKEYQGLFKESADFLGKE